MKGLLHILGERKAMIYIAENLKRLRIQHKLTQEELAESLGVSGQAVSRWETGTVCPDIELLPGIANLFSVSLDELCGMEKLRSPETLKGFFDDECKKRAEGELDGAISTLRAGLRLFPDDPGLMSELALTLTLLAKEQSDPGKAIDEAIRISERLLENNCPRKLGATTAANLVYLYISAGRYEKARELASSLPHLRECRELVRPVLDADPKTALSDSIRETLRTLCELIESSENTAIGAPQMLANGLTLESSDEEMLESIGEYLSKVR